MHTKKKLEYICEGTNIKMDGTFATNGQRQTKQGDINQKTDYKKMKRTTEVEMVSWGEECQENLILLTGEERQQTEGNQ